MTRTALPENWSLRQVLAVFVAVALVSTAGCASVLPGGGGASADAQLDSVPASADTVAFVDVDGLLADDALRGIADTYFSAQADAYGEYYSGPTSVDDALSDVENETGVSASELSGVTLFSDADAQVDGSTDEYSGLVVTSALSKADLEGALAGTERSFSTETYGEATLWVATDATTGSQAVGWLGDGTFVLGTLDAVEDVVDVRAGDAESISGDLRETFENTREGYVTYAMSVPQDEFDAGDYRTGQFDTSTFNSVDTVSGALYTEGSTVGVAVHLSADSASDASDVEDVASGAVSLYKGLVDDEDAKAALESVEVTRDGTTVSITYEDEASAIEAAIESAYNTSSASALGDAALA